MLAQYTKELGRSALCATSSDVASNKLYKPTAAWHIADSLIVYIQIGSREVKTSMCEEVSHLY